MRAALRSFRWAISAAVVLALAGGVLAATATVANAATPPPWEPDPNALGSITFYNSSGQVVTGGADDSFLADYAQASTADPTSGTSAFLEFANPQPGVPSSNWFAGAASATTGFPNASAPAPLNSSPNPLVSMSQAEGDANLSTFTRLAPVNTVTGYVNVYQVRIVTSSPGGFTGTSATGQYWEDDVLVDPATGSWSVEYAAPTPPMTTTLTASPAIATVGVPETLTATETPAIPGTVQFFDGSTSIGKLFVDSNGAATLTTTFTTEGTHSLSAVFVPIVFPAFSSSGDALSLTANPTAPTTTTLAVSQSGTTGSDVSLSATVTSAGTAVTAGTVSFYDNGSAAPLNAAPVTPDANGVATFDIPAGLAAGAHSIVADFTPANPDNFESSASAAQSFILQPPQTGACAQPGSQCTATANIEATIPVGTLVLTTPFTTSNPLNLGNLALNSGLTRYSATVPFNGITVVDTRSGDLPWTLTGLASNLSDGGSHPGSLICSQNVGLTAVTSTPGSGFAGTVTSTDNPAASPAVAPAGGACAGTQGLGGTSAHTVAAASAGLGTDVLNGTLTLNAPVSTEPGLFTGTITFTVG